MGRVLDDSHTPVVLIDNRSTASTDILREAVNHVEPETPLSTYLFSSDTAEVEGFNNDQPNKAIDVKLASEFLTTSFGKEMGDIILEIMRSKARVRKRW